MRKVRQPGCVTECLFCSYVDNRSCKPLTIGTKHMVKTLIAGVAAAILATLSTSAQSMSFNAPKHNYDDNISWTNAGFGGTRIYAFGDIEDGDTEKLLNLLSNTKVENAVVVFNSQGGSISEALKLGETIRKLGMSTTVGRYEDGDIIWNADCASACAYAFAGGVNRFYNRDGQRLGVHQFYQGPTSARLGVAEAQKISGALIAYMTLMDVDPLLITLSAKQGPDQMFWIPNKMATDLRLATNGMPLTTAELKQGPSGAYLVAEQDKEDVLGRFMFFCEGKKISVLGGRVTTAEDAASKLDWATWSGLYPGKSDSLFQRKEANPSSIIRINRMIAVRRTLSRTDTQIVLREQNIGMIFGADGMSKYGSNVDLGPVIGKVRSFVQNCYR